MYSPIQPGVPRELRAAVLYEEMIPTGTSLAYCFWRLRTKRRLSKPFHYLVLPDGCVDVIFDISTVTNGAGAIIMTPGTKADVLDLGLSFSYVGVRFLPGVWRDSPKDIVGRALQVAKWRGCDFTVAQDQMRRGVVVQEVLTALVDNLARLGIIKDTPLAGTLLDPAESVAEYVSKTSYSRRQLQRIIKERLGYSPHDFIKILRFQRALRFRTFDGYSDQSHFIRECRRILGMTPEQFYSLYD